jgi:hypothetical protein
MPIPAVVLHGLGRDLLVVLAMGLAVTGLFSSVAGLSTHMLVSRLQPSRRSRAAVVALAAGAALPGACFALLALLTSKIPGAEIAVLSVAITLLSAPGSIAGVALAVKLTGRELPPDVL